MAPVARWAAPPLPSRNCRRGVAGHIGHSARAVFLPLDEGTLRTTQVQPAGPRVLQAPARGHRRLLRGKRPRTHGRLPPLPEDGHPDRRARGAVRHAGLLHPRLRLGVAGPLRPARPHRRLHRLQRDARRRSRQLQQPPLGERGHGPLAQLPGRQRVPLEAEAQHQPPHLHQRGGRGRRHRHQALDPRARGAGAEMVPPLPARVRPAALRAHLPLLGLLQRPAEVLHPPHCGPHPHEAADGEGAHRVLGLQAGLCGRVPGVAHVLRRRGEHADRLRCHGVRGRAGHRHRVPAGARGGRCRVRGEAGGRPPHRGRMGGASGGHHGQLRHAQPRVELALRRAQLPDRAPPLPAHQPRALP